LDEPLGGGVNTAIIEALLTSGPTSVELSRFGGPLSALTFCAHPIRDGLVDMKDNAGAIYASARCQVGIGSNSAPPGGIPKTCPHEIA
jgi:hypothetical protein